MTTPKPILISGAGLASLLLARALHRSKIPFIVFERDASIVFRAQGYRLRLSRVGLDAIESVLGAEAFQKFYQRCGKTGGAGLAAVDPLTGETLGRTEKLGKTEDEDGPSHESLVSRDGKVVGISRGDMRALFLEGFEQHVRWQHHVTSYELTGSGVRVLFADGTRSVEGAMLVAGDGIKSQVAKQLSGGRLRVFDLKVRGIHGQAPASAFAALGEGVFRMEDSTTHPGGKVFLITNVRSDELHDPHAIFGWTMMGTPGVITAPNDDYSIVGPAAARIAKALTSSWHARVKPLFDSMDESEAAFWKITCSDPDGVPEWPHEPRVTLIGDAVHSMTPVGGNGANTAVRDSALLGRLLAEKGGWADGVAEAYEKEMRVYASAAVKESYMYASAQFGTKIDASTATV